MISLEFLGKTYSTGHALQRFVATARLESGTLRVMDAKQAPARDRLAPVRLLRPASGSRGQKRAEEGSGGRAQHLTCRSLLATLAAPRKRPTSAKPETKPQGVRKAPEKRQEGPQQASPILTSHSHPTSLNHPPPCPPRCPLTWIRMISVALMPAGRN